MSAFLYRLGRSCAQHPIRVLGIWLVAALAVVGVKGAAGGRFENSIRVPGVESQRAADTLRNRFPAQSGKSARIVFHARAGRLDAAGYKASVEQARRRLAAAHDVAGTRDWTVCGRSAYPDTTQPWMWDGVDVRVSHAAIAQVMTSSRSARVPPSRAWMDMPCTTVV